MECRPKEVPISSKNIFLLYGLGLLAVALTILIPTLSWLSPLTYTVIFPLAAVWLWKGTGRPLQELGYRYKPGWSYKLSIGLALGSFIPIFFLMVQVLGDWITLGRRADPTQGLASYLVILVLKMVMIVGVEELVFRGFFLQALRPKAGFRGAVVLSSFLWGLGHLTAMRNAGLTLASIFIGLSTFLLCGITLCLAYMQSGETLWLPYGLHLGLNLGFSLLGWVFILQQDAPQWWLGNPAWAPESGLLGVMVWLILATIMYRLTHKLTPGPRQQATR